MRTDGNDDTDGTTMIGNDDNNDNDDDSGDGNSGSKFSTPPRGSYKPKRLYRERNSENYIAMCKIVPIIRVMGDLECYSYAELASVFGIHRGKLHCVITRKTYTNPDYVYEYDIEKMAALLQARGFWGDERKMAPENLHKFLVAFDRSPESTAFRCPPSAPTPAKTNLKKRISMERKIDIAPDFAKLFNKDRWS